jgi:hypothetical protein
MPSPYPRTDNPRPACAPGGRAGEVRAGLVKTMMWGIEFSLRLPTRGV